MVEPKTYRPLDVCVIEQETPLSSGQSDDKAIVKAHPSDNVARIAEVIHIPTPTDEQAQRTITGMDDIIGPARKNSGKNRMHFFRL